MQAAALHPLPAIQSLGEALLIGLIIGVQRESIEGPHPGLRDFVLIALAGGVCGLLQQPWLTASALLSITILLAVYHWEVREKRIGITTEMGAVATFCITYLAAIPDWPEATPVAIGAAIAVAAFLEFKKRLQTFFREVISEKEFNGTLAFLSVVLVIYPLLPAGRFGIYNFFSPREIWFFVIVVSSISYAGYFMQKFLGPRRGLEYTALLGGLASTLATTLDLARRSRHEREHSRTYARAAVLANSVQFPRTLFIVAVTNSAMASRAALPLLAAFAVGGSLSWLLAKWVAPGTATPAPAGNPFRLKPILIFGTFFAAVVFANRAALAEIGSTALYVTSALGGLLDPGTVVLSTSDLLNKNALDVNLAVDYIFVALAANIVVKVILSAVTGTVTFAWRLLAALSVMFGAAIGVWSLVR